MKHFIGLCILFILIIALILLGIWLSRKRKTKDQFIFEKEDLKTLTPYQIEHLYPKKRVGRDNDGGYVIVELPGTYDGGISGGISNDISFEDDLLELYPDLEIIGFDGTIDELPSPHSPRLFFKRKNLGANNSSTVSNLEEELEGKENVFMKIDIEGWEMVLLPTLIESQQMSKVKQLVLEIHHPNLQNTHEMFDGLLGFSSPDMFQLLKDLQKTHTIVHFHPNNCSGTWRSKSGVILPLVFELTLVRNDFLPSKIPNKMNLPTALDMPNDCEKDDLVFNYWPFVTEN